MEGRKEGRKERRNRERKKERKKEIQKYRKKENWHLACQVGKYFFVISFFFQEQSLIFKLFLHLKFSSKSICHLLLLSSLQLLLLLASEATVELDPVYIWLFWIPMKIKNLVESDKKSIIYLRCYLHQMKHLTFSQKFWKKFKTFWLLRSLCYLVEHLYDDMEMVYTLLLSFWFKSLAIFESPWVD